MAKKAVKKTAKKATGKAAAKEKLAVKAQVDATGGDAALQRAISQIEKQYGAGSIMKMDESNISKVEGISAGAISLDMRSAVHGFHWHVCEKGQAVSDVNAGCLIAKVRVTVTSYDLRFDVECLFKSLHEVV